MVGKGDIHHRNVFYIYMCVCVLGLTAAAQLTRRSRKLKLCKTKPELFVSLSPLLLVLAGSACTGFETFVCWDVEGLCLEGSLVWDTSHPVCAELLVVQGLTGSHLVCPCPAPVPSVSALAACRDHSPTAPVWRGPFSCQRKIVCGEALILLAAK